jgi:hypothetical protein
MNLERVEKNRDFPMRDSVWYSVWDSVQNGLKTPIREEWGQE